MKDFLLSLLACLVSFGLTYLGLNQFSESLFSTFSKEETELIANNKPSNQNTIVEGSFEEDTEEDTTDLGENDNSDFEETEQKKSPKEYVISVDVDDLEKNYKTWYKYNTENIELAYEFTPIDEENTIIDKEDFLSKLKTGLYIPLKVDDGELAYKLHKISENADTKISKSIRGSSSVAYSYFKKEGTTLPNFDFSDLDGNEYNESNTKGKILVIKCWFINCVVCAQQFPELNDLYDSYEENEDIVFISLAFDKAEKLKKFLAKKEFRYPVIAEQKKYMAKKLKIKQYPTHLIVDEDNNIVKMVNNVKALTTILNQLVDVNDFNMGNEEQMEVQ